MDHLKSVGMDNYGKADLVSTHSAMKTYEGLETRLMHS